MVSDITRVDRTLRYMHQYARLTDGDHSGHAYLDDLIDWCFDSSSYLELFLEGLSIVVFSEKQ